MATSNASIYNGTINSSGNLTGNGFALNSTGLKVANGTNSVTIAAATGAITANAGTIGGWFKTGRHFCVGSFGEIGEFSFEKGREYISQQRSSLLYTDE